MKIKLLGCDRFSVWVPLSKADRVRATMENERLHAIAADQEQAKKELSYIPNSRQEYRAKLLGMVDSWIDATLFSMGPRKQDGFSFDASALQKVRAAAKELRSVIEGGMILFDTSHHDQRVSSLRERAGLPPEKPRLRLVKGAEGV